MSKDGLLCLVKHKDEKTIEKDENPYDVKMYAKGDKAYENLSEYKEAIACVALLKNCAKKKDLREGTSLHVDVVKRGFLQKNPYVGSALIHMYVKCGCLDRAQQVLDELFLRDVVSWSTLISGYAQQGQGEEALNCFERMQNEGLSPDSITFVCILKACGSIGAINKGKQIHKEIVDKGLLGKDAVLGTALVNMYAKCGELEKAAEVFKELPCRNVVSWNALISGYIEQGQSKDALGCFEQMENNCFSPNAVTFTCILKACGITRSICKGTEIHKKIVSKGLLDKDPTLGSALVDMYVQCGDLSKAQQVLKL